MVTSFLSPAAVANIAKATQRGHMTRLALQGGGTSLILSRWSDAQQEHIAIAAQTVAVEFADRQERAIRDESGQAVTIDGWLEKLAPFDVERGDRFALGPVGDEERGEIVVVRPAKLGVQRAAFRLALGEM